MPENRGSQRQILDQCAASSDVGHLPPRPGGRCSWVMFLSDQRLCPVSIGAARARLADLVKVSWLGGACGAAYRHGIDHLLWARPPDGMAAVPRLVQAHFLDPVHRDEATIMGMRWDAIGVTGQPFPALDADITLTAEGGQHTRVMLTGAYRPPPGGISGELDRVLLHQAATATIGSLLTRMSGALQGTTPAPGDRGAQKP